MKARDCVGMTLIELLVVLSVIGLLVGLLAPAVQCVREAARRVQCTNNLKQMALATLNYEAAHRRFPPGRLAPDWRVKGAVRAAYTSYENVDLNPRAGHWTGFRSVHTFILPFMEQTSVYDLIDFSVPTNVRLTTDGGTTPLNPNFAAYSKAVGLFICPACPNTASVTSENNYRYNFGGSTPFGGAIDAAHNNNYAAVSPSGYSCRGNGAFTIGAALTVAAISDGLSNTIFFSERTKGSGLDLTQVLPTRADVTSLLSRPQGLIDGDELLQECSAQPLNLNGGFNFNSAGRWLPGSDYSNGWPFGFYSSTMYNHVAPPNWSSIDCGTRSAIADAPGEHAIITARSSHSRGVNCAAGDGSIRFVSESIDLITWRSLGTRDQGEFIQLED